jgi:hypothetical protein
MLVFFYGGSMFAPFISGAAVKAGIFLFVIPTNSIKSYTSYANRILKTGNEVKILDEIVQSKIMSLDDATRSLLRADIAKDETLLEKLLDDTNAIIARYLQGAGKTGIKVVDDFLETLPKINNISNADLPADYQIFTKNGSKYIRRIDVNNPNTPRLMVDETGTIVPYLKPQRLANSTKSRSNLEKVLGKAPDNHQAHHIVPSNVVEKSALHGETMKRGLYDVDRAGNGKFLAETDEDLLLPGASSDFPTHLGSHPNYDIQIRNQINQIILDNDIDIFNLQNLSNQQLNNIINAIENRALTVLENWQPSKLN